jgi:hypothetical protein
MANRVFKGEFAPGFGYTLRIESFPLRLYDEAGTPIATTSSQGVIEWDRAEGSLRGTLDVPGGSLPINQPLAPVSGWDSYTVALLVNPDGSIQFWLSAQSTDVRWGS